MAYVSKYFKNYCCFIFVSSRNVKKNNFVLTFGKN